MNFGIEDGNGDNKNQLGNRLSKEPNIPLCTYEFFVWEDTKQIMVHSMSCRHRNILTWFSNTKNAYHDRTQQYKS